MKLLVDVRKKKTEKIYSKILKINNFFEVYQMTKFKENYLLNMYITIITE